MAAWSWSASMSIFNEENAEAWRKGSLIFFNRKERRERKDENIKDAKAISTNFYFFSAFFALRLIKIPFIAFLAATFLKMLYCGVGIVS
jgi:hypothetical protein